MTDVPLVIMERYRNITLAIDIMFINKVPFFITISRNVKFRTVEMIMIITPPRPSSLQSNRLYKHIIAEAS